MSSSDYTAPKHSNTVFSLRSSSTGESAAITGITTIGRGVDCDITLNSPRISRHHATLTPGSGKLILEDLESSNGTFINGAKISGSTIATTGDKVSFDTFNFRITSPNVRQTAKAGTSKQEQTKQNALIRSNEEYADLDEELRSLERNKALTQDDKPDIESLARIVKQNLTSELAEQEALASKTPKTSSSEESHTSGNENHSVAAKQQSFLADKEITPETFDLALEPLESDFDAIDSELDLSNKPADSAKPKKPSSPSPPIKQASKKQSRETNKTVSHPSASPPAKATQPRRSPSTDKAQTAQHTLSKTKDITQVKTGHKPITTRPKPSTLPPKEPAQLADNTNLQKQINCSAQQKTAANKNPPPAKSKAKTKTAVQRQIEEAKNEKTTLDSVDHPKPEELSRADKPNKTQTKELRSSTKESPKKNSSFTAYSPSSSQSENDTMMDSVNDDDRMASLKFDWKAAGEKIPKPRSASNNDILNQLHVSLSEQEESTDDHDIWLTHSSEAHEGRHSFLSAAITQSPQLVMRTNPNRGKIYSLNDEKSEWIIGRAAEADIYIADKQIALQHAKVELTSKGFVIETCQLTNPMLINSRFSNRSTLNNGDILQFGGIEMLFQAPLDDNDEQHNDAIEQLIPSHHINYGNYLGALVVAGAILYSIFAGG